MVSVVVLFIAVGCVLVWSLSSLGWLGTFGLLGLSSKEYLFSFLWDEVVGVCGFMLLCCGALALFYCFHYFSGGSEGGLLFPLLVWFLLTMAVLICSSSLLFTLVFWEYLGLVSFFLILFYSNTASLRASLITLFASRFGDVALFVMLGWLCWWLDLSYSVFVILGGLVIMTKSACYPFVSWLLEAMRAPTPVSSLVHSSTLVAAGVWFLFRYDSLWAEDIYGVLFCFAVLTIILTGVCASFFNDLKKLVALSTCNNVSWCVVFFICGDLGLALLQLLCHGLCKCYLFMSVGDLMGVSGSSQSAVGVFLSRYGGGYGSFVQVLLIFSLSGLPFLGVFFSKHGLFSSLLYVFGGGSLGLLCLGFFLTYVYSVRFVLLLLKSAGGLSSGYSSSFLLVSLMSFLGTVLNFWGVSFFDELMELDYGGSVTLLMIQILGCLGGLFLFWWGFWVSGGIWESVLWGSDCLVGWVYAKFLPLSGGFFLSFYRWEIWLVGVLGGRLFPSGLSSSLFSLNFMVCGLVFVLLFFFLVGV